MPLSYDTHTQDTHTHTRDTHTHARYTYTHRGSHTTAASVNFTPLTYYKTEPKILYIKRNTLPNGLLTMSHTPRDPPPSALKLSPHNYRAQKANMLWKVHDKYMLQGKFRSFIMVKKK